MEKQEARTVSESHQNQSYVEHNDNKRMAETEE